MWDHVTLRASDFEGSARFYDLVLATLDVERTGTADWIIEWDLFSISPANAEKPRDMLAAGYRDNGGPGERPEYHEGYYGAFVLDPDGNNVEVVFHDR